MSLLGVCKHENNELLNIAGLTRLRRLLKHLKAPIADQKTARRTGLNDGGGPAALAAFSMPAPVADDGNNLCDSGSLFMTAQIGHL